MRMIHDLLTTGRREVRFLTSSLLNPYLNNAGRSAAPDRNSTCTPSAETEQNYLITDKRCGFNARFCSLTMFSISCGRCRRTVFTAWKMSTSPCWITCSMQALAAQYTPARLRPSLCANRKPFSMREYILHRLTLYIQNMKPTAKPHRLDRNRFLRANSQPCS